MDQPIVDLIYKKYEAEREKIKPRNYMGASLLGHHCERFIWLSYRHLFTEKFEGRMLRLFQRGHLEELQVFQDLLSIGIDVKERKETIQISEHIQGHCDGIIDGNTVLEIKTHNKKSFDNLVRHKIKKAKPQHFEQMQLYMHGLKYKKALYFAVSKDDDRLYTEVVEYEEKKALKIIKKGERLATDDISPPPISFNPAWFQCKMCAAWELCHGVDKDKY